MYTVNLDKARKALPAAAVKDFDDIVEQRVLGASKHIQMIGKMIEQIAVDSVETNRTIAEMLERIQEVCQFFIHTRGEASQAITNAVYLMTAGYRQHEERDIRTYAQRIIDVKKQYERDCTAASETAVSYAVEIGNRMSAIMVYDYSSSVEAFLRKINGPKRIYIPESRVINGGAPFVQPCLEAGHQIHFIPDASMMYYMKSCDGVFMGAESIYPDGTGFNTTGSDIVGLLCDYFHVPLYFISPLIKLDVRPVYGKEKCTVINDLRSKLEPVANPKQVKGTIDYTAPELLAVSPGFIKAFITEQGVIPATQLYDISMKYIKELRGADDV